MPLYMKPTSTIKANLGLDKNGRIQRFFQMSCYKHMDRFVPRRLGVKGGSLRETVDLSDPKYIVYEMPYAHAQYVGYTTGPVRHYSTPGTGPYWADKMWSVDRKIIEKEVQIEFERGGN